MKLFLTTVATLLPLVASTLHPKSFENRTISDNIIIDDTNVLPDSQPFTWRKRELACLVKELRGMDIYGGSFTGAVKMDKILLSGEDTLRGDEYRKLLANRIITFVTEAEIYGLKIGGAIRKLIRSLKSNIDNNLISLLMESNNMEIKAAVLSVFGNVKDTWETYYPKIKEDEELQKRILELIDLESSENAVNIVVNWGASLSSEDENIEIKPWKGENALSCFKLIFPLYVKYSLQYREISPEQVIVEFLNADNLKDLIRELGKDYVPTGTSAEHGVDLAIIVFSLSFREAKEMLSKSNWNLLPEKDKLRISSICKGPREFLLKNYLNLDKIYELDFSDAELVEKLLRSGNSEEISCHHSRIFYSPFSREAAMKIGEIAALLLLEVSRNPTKYSWVSNKFRILINITYKIIRSCQLSFDTKQLNPVMAALDLAFDGGELVDLVTRYQGYSVSFLSSLLLKEKTRGRYIRDIGCRFALKKLIGDEDYYNFGPNSEMRDLLANNYILDNIDSISYVTLWKRLMEHTAQLRNPIETK